ncbi:alanine racemase [Paraglaciecola sp. 2405UD69-4]|uniref:alanine racemase n=1 Tax=Paraglaciecola sp. 2405UD69-4 TaxID=3391836 RepID=UPI0039C968AD
MSRPAKIYVDLDALKANYKLAQTLAPNSSTIAVVKADAYGHGSVEISKALQSSVEMFAVSCLEEALTLRQAGIEKPILLLEGCFSADEIPIASEHNCQIVIHNQEQIEALENAAIHRPMPVWLKIDTGMHRLGFAPEALQRVYSQLQRCQQVSNIVLMSHFSHADDLASTSAQRQINMFEQCLDTIHTKDIPISLANSAAILARPNSHGDWNRAGIMLYGLSPFLEPQKYADKLQAVMSFESSIIAVRWINAGESVGYGDTWTAKRRSLIATIAVGYGDGYPRTAKSGTPVLVNHQRVCLVGRVSMDLISVDVTDLKEAKVGDHVELWGKNLSANEVAKWAGTIGYELVTRMPKRAQRLIKS